MQKQQAFFSIHLRYKIILSVPTRDRFIIKPLFIDDREFILILAANLGFLSFLALAEPLPAIKY